MNVYYPFGAEGFVEVKLLAVYDNYAMLRRKGAIPFVGHTKSIVWELKK